MVEPLERRRRRSVGGGSTMGRRVCSLALVADHIFHQVRSIKRPLKCFFFSNLALTFLTFKDRSDLPQEVGRGDLAATVLQMLYHVREANAVFLTKDFDNNGTSDCMGFQVSITITIPTAIPITIH